MENIPVIEESFSRKVPVSEGGHLAPLYLTRSIGTEQTEAEVLCYRTQRLEEIKNRWITLRKMEPVESVHDTYYVTDPQYKELEQFREDLIESSYWELVSMRGSGPSERDCFKMITRKIAFELRLKELSISLGISYEEAKDLDKLFGINGT